MGQSIVIALGRLAALMRAVLAFGRSGVARALLMGSTALVVTSARAQEAEPIIPNDVGFGPGVTTAYTGADENHFGGLPLARYHLTDSCRYASLVGTAQLGSGRSRSGFHLDLRIQQDLAGA